MAEFSFPDVKTHMPGAVNPSEAVRRLNVFALRAPSLAAPLTKQQADEVRSLLKIATTARPEDIGDIMIFLRKEELRGRPAEAKALDAITPSQKRDIGSFKIRSVISEATTHLSTPPAWFLLRDVR